MIKRLIVVSYFNKVKNDRYLLKLKWKGNKIKNDRK